MQNHARSSYAAPTCTSSQSRTAARSDPSTIRFPIRKSPCTKTVGDCSGRCAASQRKPHSKVAVVSPIASSRWRHSTSWSSWVSPGACASARWIAANAWAHCRSKCSRAPALSAPSSWRWMRRTMVSPLISSQMRNGLPSAAGELSARRTCGTGAPAAAAAACAWASSSMPACTSSGGPVRRISERRCPSVTASNAHVVRLAPPVNARRLSTEVPAPSAVCSTAASLVPNSALSTITSCRI